MEKKYAATFTGDLIRKYRKEKGWTQKQLGEKCQMPDSQIRQYELGMVNPKTETLRRIAEALEVPILKLGNLRLYEIDEIKEDLINNTPQLNSTETKQVLSTNSNRDLLILKYDELNESGQTKALEQIELLTKIPDYRKE